ncbi:MAG: hypothetical protein ACKOCH_00205, partial [Bacteroidota bacterium]
ILKDKTFYYLNAEFTRDLKDNLLSSPALGVNETVPGQNNFNYLSARQVALRVWRGRICDITRARYETCLVIRSKTDSGVSKSASVRAVPSGKTRLFIT